MSNKITVNGREIVDYYSLLKQFENYLVSKDSPKTKTIYAVGRNIDRLEPMAKRVQEVLKQPSEDVQEYQRDRLAFVEDQTGVSVQGKKTINASDFRSKAEKVGELDPGAKGYKQAVDEKAAELYEKFIDDLDVFDDEHDEQIKKLEALEQHNEQQLDEISEELDVYAIYLSNLPETADGMLVQFMRKLDAFIVDDVNN